MMMFDLLLLAVAIGFSTYWMATFVTWESGPFGVFERLRFAVPPETRLSQWVHCPICQGPLWVVCVELMLWLCYLRAVWLAVQVAEALLVWLIGTGVHVFLCRVGTPDMRLFEIQKTMELERAALREARGSERRVGAPTQSAGSQVEQ